MQNSNRIITEEQPNPLAQAHHEFNQMVSDIQSDIDRYVYLTHYHWLLIFFTSQGVWATTQYRVSRWVHYHVHLPVVRTFLKFICAIWQKLIEIMTGAEIPNRAEIGKGLFLPHARGLVIHCDAKIGEYCNLSQNVTIGIGGRGENRGTPTLSDRVYVAPGACLFGPITVGSDVAVGANAVVTKSLPNNAVAVGVPAQVISYQGSQDFILYRQ